ncbi:hypothetical protein Mp_4g22560 [Marchantia polymorpha subsp. ruderalis]|uniref:Uncharacterized protein n=2 Tax=Marchantia polymorpha TaxID=3197 RepID=A0AAF6BCN8_MARPO|nr:hypothetical protein MARPO_0020s0026 [Marchantia polymorpha]BBN09772.1 hypothetical protein Mp_4g22560 [Marchantia polymorpha subsp. ruderalis]|eukprot:PTQ44354.1 hypothetical protein MARPO_0020s0026 [Marchantia polymorpha]
MQLPICMLPHATLSNCIRQYSKWGRVSMKTRGEDYETVKDETVTIKLLHCSFFEVSLFRLSIIFSAMDSGLSFKLRFSLVMLLCGRKHTSGTERAFMSWNGAE